MTASVQPAAHSALPGHGEDGTSSDHHEHPKFLAHHFDTPQQQFDSGKLGIWLFLITEILFFSGLFCAYTLWRTNHPEIFVDGHHYLDKTLGAVNTIVLLFSSLTMAWGVRCAQLGQRTGLVVCLLLTLACAGGFMGIKYVEYSHKWHDGLLWAGRFQPGVSGGWPDTIAKPQELIDHLAAVKAGTATTMPPALQTYIEQVRAGVPNAKYVTDATASHEDAHDHDAAHATQHHDSADGTHASGDHGHDMHHSPQVMANLPPATGAFFSIYFCLTGLHGLHIVGGMIAITWILVRSIRGDFGPQYFGPVDYVGLYWHLVDLIWIYLFPLLYLING